MEFTNELKIDINCPSCSSRKVINLGGETTLARNNNNSSALFICNDCDYTFNLKYRNDATDSFQVLFDTSECTRESILEFYKEIKDEGMISEDTFKDVINKLNK